MSTATLTIRRHSPKDTKDRHISVKLDGETLGHFDYGDEEDFEIEPGSHVIRASNTLNKRELTFHINAGEHRAFMIGHAGSELGYVMMGIIGTGFFTTFLEEIPTSGHV